MKIIKTSIKGVFEVEGLPFIDKRGSFLRLYDSIKLKKLWKKRKDFRVITFQKDANLSQYKWADNKPPLQITDRNEYLRTLQEK